MSSKTWIIETREQLAGFLARARDWKIERPICIKVTDQNIRTLEQNKKLHAELQDISKQCEFAGKKRTVDEWKTLMVSGYDFDKKRSVEVLQGIEGEPVSLRRSTTEMSIGELSELIEYIQAWRYG